MQSKHDELFEVYYEAQRRLEEVCVCVWWCMYKCVCCVHAMKRILFAGGAVQLRNGETKCHGNRGEQRVSTSFLSTMYSLTHSSPSHHHRTLQQLRALVAMNENLKKQEQQFKAHCKVIPSHPHTVTHTHHSL